MEELIETLDVCLGVQERNLPGNPATAAMRAAINQWKENEAVAKGKASFKSAAQIRYDDLKKQQFKIKRKRPLTAAVR